MSLWNEQRRKLLNILLGTSVGATLVAILYPILKFMIPQRAGIARCEGRATNPFFGSIAASGSSLVGSPP